MRFATSLAASLALFAITTTAAATVTEPNGLAVPIDSTPETQLYTLFTSRGESINWQTDAHTTPNAFSPLCGFTATYVLNQAGSHFGLAWYNDTGTTPAATDLHQLVAANSAVGTTFSGTVIRSDPAYTGGLVGFALIGGETHYTNPAYDTLCSGCNPQAPWITALMYASTVSTSAYYICFEDGSTSATSWNNDGDFNDDVYFVTGISCSGGGLPCDTGKPGICEAGLTQCAATGTTCVELNPPAPKETCNGLDDDCNGQTDEGPICPVGFVCQKGSCVAACLNGEFQCSGGLVCSTDGYCVEPSCANVTCTTAGQVCIAGLCKAPCDGVTCPYPQVCRVGTCVDPCAGVTCQTGQVCDQGVCIASCACQPCAGTTVCNSVSGQCVEAACKTVTCATGTHCVGGPCVDDCAGATCPAGQACQGGACVASNVTPDAGSGAPGLNFPGGDDGGSGAGVDGGLGGGNGASPSSSSAASSGCGCRAAGTGTESGALALAFALGLTVVRRGRARRKKR